MIGLLSMI